MRRVAAVPLVMLQNTRKERDIRGLSEHADHAERCGTFKQKDFAGIAITPGMAKRTRMKEGFIIGDDAKNILKYSKKGSVGGGEITRGE